MAENAEWLPLQFAVIHKGSAMSSSHHSFIAGDNTIRGRYDLGQRNALRLHTWDGRHFTKVADVILIKMADSLESFHREPHKPLMPNITAFAVYPTKEYRSEKL